MVENGGGRGRFGSIGGSRSEGIGVENRPLSLRYKQRMSSEKYNKNLPSYINKKLEELDGYINDIGELIVRLDNMTRYNFGTMSMISNTLGELILREFHPLDWIVIREEELEEIGWRVDWLCNLGKDDLSLYELLDLLMGISTRLNYLGRNLGVIRGFPEDSVADGFMTACWWDIEPSLIEEIRLIIAKIKAVVGRPVPALADYAEIMKDCLKKNDLRLYNEYRAEMAMIFIYMSKKECNPVRKAKLRSVALNTLKRAVDYFRNNDRVRFTVWSLPLIRYTETPEEKLRLAAEAFNVYKSIKLSVPEPNISIYTGVFYINICLEIAETMKNPKPLLHKAMEAGEPLWIEALQEDMYDVAIEILCPLSEVYRRLMVTEYDPEKRAILMKKYMKVEKLLRDIPAGRIDWEYILD